MARNPETDTKNLDLAGFYLKYDEIEAPGKPVYCTETGNPTTGFNDPTLWMPRISEAAAGKYALRTALEYFRVGIKRTFFHELVDEHSDPHRSESNFGMLRNDWTPKPEFIGISNMNAILKDPGRSFRTGKLDYDMSGPEVSAGRVHHLLLQKRNGTFYLVLWHAVPSYDPDRKVDLSPADAEVSIDFHGRVRAVRTFRPLDEALSSTPSADRVLRVSGPLSIGAPDQPLILELNTGGRSARVRMPG